MYFSFHAVVCMLRNFKVIEGPRECEKSATLRLVFRYVSSTNFCRSLKYVSLRSTEYRQSYGAPKRFTSAAAAVVSARKRDLGARRRQGDGTSRIAVIFKKLDNLPIERREFLLQVKVDEPFHRPEAPRPDRHARSRDITAPPVVRALRDHRTRPSKNGGSLVIVNLNLHVLNEAQCVVRVQRLVVHPDDIPADVNEQ